MKKLLLGKLRLVFFRPWKEKSFSSHRRGLLQTLLQPWELFSLLNESTAWNQKEVLRSIYVLEKTCRQDEPCILYLSRASRVNTEGGSESESESDIFSKVVSDSGKAGMGLSRPAVPCAPPLVPVALYHCKPRRGGLQKHSGKWAQTHGCKRQLNKRPFIISSRSYAAHNYNPANSR